MVSLLPIYEHSEQARPPPHTERGTCPGVGLLVYFKRRCTTREDDGGAHAIVRGGAGCASQVLHRCALAVSRGAARCASQVLDRGAHADVRGTTHVLDRGVQAVSRGAARCALHVHGRGARTDACGRSFAVLSMQVSTVGLRLRLEVPRPMPAAVASRWCQRRFPTWLALSPSRFETITIVMVSNLDGDRRLNIVTIMLTYITKHN